MQIVIKLRGVLKIALFFGCALFVVAYAGYKSYQYISYRKIMYDTDQKQKRNLRFHAFIKTDSHSVHGYLLLSSIATWHHISYSDIIIMNTDGQVLLQKQMKGIIYDFRQWHNEGRTLYSYAINERQDSASGNTASCSHIVILDSALNEIKQIHLKTSGTITASEKQDLDPHDFIMLPGDHCITMAGYLKTVNNIPPYLFPSAHNHVIVPVIQEVRNGSVVWQWDASAYPEFYIGSTGGNKFYDSTTQDYIHINSMTIDPRDSNLIVSFLNQNQVAKIDRHTGNILWRLGGSNSDFPLTGSQVFLRQHNATLTDSNNTLMLLDNGIDSIRPYSRVLEFRLDEQNKKVVSFKAFSVPARIIGSRGSVQKINGDYIICGGIAGYILIVDGATGATKLELKANQTFYRAYLVDDITGIKQNQAGAN